MKLRTSELTGAALDWAVAKGEGRVLNVPDSATNEDVAKLQVPFKMYGTTCRSTGGELRWFVEEVTVYRFGILHELGATAPSISFTDDTGQLCSGTAGLFYLRREDAQLDADQENLGGLEGFEPSTDWAKGGPIIEREHIGVCYYHEADGWEIPNWAAWRTDIDDRVQLMGETALIAGMRCYVASKLGDEVDVPEELLS